MSDIHLILGPVAFQDFEVPGGINFGGAQRLAIHRLAGGGRVIDALGREDADIRFAGTFSGADATLRARTLDELRVAGTPLPLTWDVFFYTVTIRQFQAEYQNGWWIPYRMICSVIRDEASVLVRAALSLAADVASDIAVAAAQASPVGFDMAAAQAAVTVPAATVRGSTAFIAAQSNLANTQVGLSQAITTAEMQLDDVTLTGATTSGDGIDGLAAAVASSQQLAALTNARGYLGRAAVNIATAST